MPRGVSQFDAETKEAIVREALEAESQKAVADRHGVSERTLYRWVSKFRRKHGLPPPSSVKMSSREKASDRRILRRLEELDRKERGVFSTIERIVEERATLLAVLLKRRR